MRSANNVSGPSSSIFTLKSHHHIVCILLVPLRFSIQHTHTLPEPFNTRTLFLISVNIDGQRRPVTTLHSPRSAPQTYLLQSTACSCKISTIFTTNMSKKNPPGKEIKTQLHDQCLAMTSVYTNFAMAPMHYRCERDSFSFKNI